MGYRRLTARSVTAAKRKASSKRTVCSKANKIKGKKNLYGVYTHKRKA